MSLRRTWVHIQHLTCLSADLPGDIAARGIPVALTLNDYWLACHRGQLFDLDGARCAGPFEGGCARCIPQGALAGPRSYASAKFVRTLPVPGAGHAVDLAVKIVDRLRAPASTRAATEDRLRHMRESSGLRRSYSGALARPSRLFPGSACGPTGSCGAIKALPRPVKGSGPTV